MNPEAGSDVRKNTITFDPIRCRKPSLHELAELLNNIGIELDDVVCVQEEVGSERVHVKLPDGEEMREKIVEIVRQPVRTVRKSEEGPEEQVLVTENGRRMVQVRVRNVPPELPQAQLEEELRHYGDVTTLREGVFVSGPFAGKLNGERMMGMVLTKHVPSFVWVKGVECCTAYKGQPQTCRRCHGRGHFASRCQARDEEETEEEEGGVTGDTRHYASPRLTVSEPPPDSEGIQVVWMEQTTDDEASKEGGEGEGAVTPEEASEPAASSAEEEEEEGEEEASQAEPGGAKYASQFLKLTELVKKDVKNPRKKKNEKDKKRGAEESPEGSEERKGRTTRSRKN